MHVTHVPEKGAGKQQTATSRITEERDCSYKVRAG